MKLHTVEVLDRQRYGDHVHVRCRWPGEPPEPGQFVMVRAVGHGFDPFLSRPFFAHDYEDGVLELLIVVQGRGTALLADDTSGLLISDPVGQGFRITGDSSVALVGGGVWVSPLRLLYRALRSREIPHDIYLEAPTGSSSEYREFLKERFPEAVLVDTGGGSVAAEELMARVGDLSLYEDVYVSGTQETLAAAKSASAGVVGAQLAVRERMACANGSCYGCAVPVWRAGERNYVRACVDGPVFEAAELVW